MANERAVEVILNDIKTGRSNDSFHCPLAQTIWRTYQNLARVEVRNHNIAIQYKDGRTEIGRLPDEAQEFIHDVDKHLEVKPFYFKMRMVYWIVVTQDYIRDGEPNNPEACTLALAIKASVPNIVKVEVNDTYVNLYFANDHTESYILPYIAKVMHDRLNHGFYEEPISFALDDYPVTREV
jgi:hypothetical protein